jgi:hypothetical protein
MNNEFGKDTEGSDGRLILGNKPFSWRDCEKSRKIEQPVFGPRFESGHTEYEAGVLTTRPRQLVKHIETERGSK